MSQDQESLPPAEKLGARLNASAPLHSKTELSKPASSDPLAEHNSERLTTTQVSESSATILENQREPAIKEEINAAPIPFDQLGAYEVLGELGRGGMGVVYKARHKDLDRFVALKILTISGGATKDAMERFLTEGKIAAKLDDHDHIARVLDCGRIDGYSYLAMEFVQGTTFAELIKTEKISIEQGLEVVVAVASALTYAHSKGVIHRDLKPENVLIDECGKAFLTDFGVAKILHDSRATVTGAIMGTLHFMAPEQAEDASRIDARCDVYGLGAMLYNLLTGRPPHVGQSAASVLASLLTKEAPNPRSLNENVTPELEQLCLKALQRNPDHRYQSMAEMKTALDFCHGVKVDSVSTKAIAIVPIKPKESTSTEASPGSEDPDPELKSKAAAFVSGLVVLIGALLFIIFGTNNDLPKQEDPKPAPNKTAVSPNPQSTEDNPVIEETPPLKGRALQLLEDLRFWDRAPSKQQDAAIVLVAKQLGDAFEFVKTMTFTTTRTVKGKAVLSKHRLAIFRHKKLGMDFHLIPGGQCYIGTKNGKTELKYCQKFDDENWGRGDIATELPRVLVTFLPLLVARTETSQRAWDIYGGKDDRAFKEASYPIESIEWTDIGKWLKKVGDGLRLPSEFEWEYACRAGAQTRYYWGDEMDGSQCHHAHNSEGRPLAVTDTRKGQNAFGLIHMTGNVREWCQ
ncbi:MAG: bifunctional serine/threonine-protein kinase/formylglycine-generating enzyme family protein, partial [Planctomycetota bacterium]|nr:bifunctional serine/threonine-protein kinase/formylglycine-generating enzyme family protein [Planctomycetota bacterium]